jgi:hypothetical protein
MWEYQVQLNPGQTKNAWVINGTLDLADVYLPYVSVINQGIFPPTNPTPTPTASLTPTPTDTPSVTTTPTVTNTPSQTATNTPTPSITASITPSVTQTQTQTPTNTQTQTQTPTNTQTQTQTPTNTTTSTNTPTPSATPTITPSPTEPTRYTFSVPHSETSAQEACYTSNNATIFGNAATFVQTYDDYGFFWGCPTGTCPEVDLSGYYVNDGLVYELDAAGTVTLVNPCGVTPTPTTTATNTPTVTQTPTQTIGYYQYSLGTGATSNDACIDFGSAPNTIYGSVAGGPGPNVSETLYFNSGLTVPVINGYYSNGTRWYQVTGGSGLITSSNLC